MTNDGDKDGSEMKHPVGRVSHRGYYAILALTVVVALGLTAGAFSLVRSWERDSLESRFEKEATARASVFEMEMDGHISELEALGRFYEGSKFVDRNEFRAFVGPVLLDASELQAMGWIPRVSGSERQFYEDAARSDGLDGFEIREMSADGSMVTASQRGEYYPVFYVEPLEGNEATLGFDFGSDPVRLAALEQARDTGQRVATSRIKMVQETGDQFGFLVFRPVYRSGAATETVEDRRANIEGFVLGVFRIGDAFEEAISGLTPAGINVRVLDLSAPEGESFLHAHTTRKFQGEADALTESEATDISGLRHITEIDVAGRTWAVVSTPSSGFLAANRPWQSWSVLALGLIITVWSVTYMVGSHRRTARMEVLVEERTAELRESETRFRDIFGNVCEAIFYMDTGGIILNINDRSIDICGLPPGEIIGRNFADLDILDPEELARLTGLFAANGARVEAVPLVEARLNHRDGHQVAVEVTMRIFTGPSGELQGFMGTIRDVTERKRMEQQVLLSGRLAAIGELAAGVAHELNNPLTAVQGYAQFLATRNDLDESIRDDVETIFKEAKRATKITANLLSFARKHEHETSLICINEVIRQSLELHIYRMRVNNIEVTTELDADLPQTMADFHQLQQVFANLVTNAEHAMTEANARGKLTIKTQLVGDVIRTSFTDDGPGISEDNLERIFDPFFTTKGVGKGTGLGLSICFGIVEQHGGRIYATSNPGKRTTFTVELPVVPKERRAAEWTDSMQSQEA